MGLIDVCEPVSSITNEAYLYEVHQGPLEFQDCACIQSKALRIAFIMYH